MIFLWTKSTKIKYIENFSTLFKANSHFRAILLSKKFTIIFSKDKKVVIGTNFSVDNTLGMVLIVHISINRRQL